MNEEVRELRVWDEREHCVPVRRCSSTIYEKEDSDEKMFVDDLREKSVEMSEVIRK